MPIVTNGTFDVDTSGWTAVNATLSDVSQRMRVTNSGAAQGHAYQAVTVVAGQPYRITWDAFVGSIAPILLVGNSSTGSEYCNVTGAGTGQTCVFTPTQTTIYIGCWVGSAAAGAYSDFDNISIVSAQVPASVSDVINAHDAQVVGFPVALSDGFGMPDLLHGIRATPGAITDGIGIHDAIVGKLGVLVAEQLRIGDTWSTKWIGTLSIAESIFVHDALARGLPVTLNDGIGLNFALTAGQLVNVVEQLGLRDIVAPVFKYNLSIAEQLQFADTLARFIGAGIIENLQFAGTPVGVGHMYAAVTDGLGLSTDLSSSRLVLRATINDGIDITDHELVKMIFRGVIQEGIQIAAGYFEPNGSITTWAMNTRTHAVTEYTNYNFNSFARVGDKYLGASQSGLYDLSGDTDAGTSIIADIKSGLAQFAGVHLSSFKGAYIAARGGGSYVLKLFTGTGQEYHFSVTTDSMKTARIDLGKGIRARYFAFELISSGQDFDLDSLEFIPLIAKRRV